MTTWLHNCSFNGKVITMESEDESCSLCKTTYSEEVIRLSEFAPKLPQQREKQVPILFKAFKNE